MFKIIFLAGILVAGCTHTQQMTNKKISREDMYVKFNQYAQKREGEIKLINGVLRKGKSFRIESDSIRFVDKLRTDELTVPITGVEYVSFKNTGKGMAEGALIGTLSGFLIGFMTVLLTYNPPDPDDEEVYDYTGFVSMIFGGIGAGTGLLIGSFAGAGEGSKEVFVFNKRTIVK